MTAGIVGESDLAGILKTEYVFFDGERVARRDFPAGTVSYYYYDHLKTASVVTDASGTILDESDYYPWGGELQFTNNLDNHYKFTGKERDSESGLDYFGARYYSNGLGRFITPDWAAKATAVPYAEFTDPQSLNLYTYVRNVPTARYDVDGHCQADDCKKITVTPEVYKQPELKTEVKGGTASATAEGEVRYTIKYDGKPMKDTPVHQDVTSKESRDGRPMHGGKTETITRDDSTNKQGVIADQTSFSISIPGLSSTNLVERFMTNSVFEKNTTQTIAITSPSGSAYTLTQNPTITTPPQKPQPNQT